MTATPLTRRTTLALAAAALASPAAAGDWMSDLRSSRGGSTFRLPPGSYPNIKLSGVTFSTPVVIDARGSVLTNWTITGCAGLTLTGAVIQPSSYIHPRLGLRFGNALSVINSERISILDCKITGPRDPAANVLADGIGLLMGGAKASGFKACAFSGLTRGVVFGSCTDFYALDSTFTDLRSDGINVGQCWGGRIIGNVFTGTQASGGDHPDAIQMWSRPNAPPTSDIEVRGNSVTGATQGIFLGNKLRNGVDDGGFDRITIIGNTVNVSAPNAIRGSSIRGLVLKDNVVTTLPGAPYVANLIFQNCTQVQRSGNRVGPGAGKPGFRD